MNIDIVTTLRKSILRKGGFAANVLTLMTGTTLSQVLGIAIAPILTRLYSPQDFGILALIYFYFKYLGHYVQLAL
jgi:O-antigen/teichoic acid export membrane protein